MKPITQKIIIVILLVLPLLSQGQSQLLTAQIIDNETKSPIKDAIVYSNDSIITSNSSGYFQIMGMSGDTLQIRHQEYENTIIIVPNESRFAIGLNKKRSDVNIVYSQYEVDQKPEPVNGINDFKRLWVTNIVKFGYPKEAQKHNIEGSVFIYFIVDEFGKVIESGIEKGIGYGCDEVVLKAFNSTHVEWKPGVKNNEKVKVKMVIPFIFRLQ